MYNIFYALSNHVVLIICKSVYNVVHALGIINYICLNANSANNYFALLQLMHESQKYIFVTYIHESWVMIYDLFMEQVCIKVSLSTGCS